MSFPFDEKRPPFSRKPATPTTLYAKQNTYVIVDITNVLRFPRSITYVNTFGNRLRRARKLRKLTQAQLAQACGLSQGAIGNYEADSRRSAKEIFRIAEVLEVEPAWLAMGTGPMERQSAPQISEGSSSAGAWPFPNLDPARIWALSAEQRLALGDALSAMVAAMEAQGADPHS